MAPFLRLVLIAAMPIGGCSGGEGATSPSPPGSTNHVLPPSTTIGSDDDEEERSRIEELETFVADPALAGAGCGALSTSNGSVEIDASGSRLGRRVQAQTAVPAAKLKLRVNFGAGFPSFTCTDLETEVREARIDETWPASASDGVHGCTE